MTGDGDNDKMRLECDDFADKETVDEVDTV